MSTFAGRSSSHLLSSVAEVVDSIEAAGNEVHTITLVLNGTHGEFDLTVDAADPDQGEVRVQGVASRAGGVTDLTGAADEDSALHGVC